MSITKSLRQLVTLHKTHWELDGNNMAVLLDTLQLVKDPFSGVLIMLIKYGSRLLAKEDGM